MGIDQKKVSERIHYIMRDLSLTQKQLAEKLGVTQPAISLYLSDRIPPAPILLKLAILSGKTIEWILTGDIENMIHQISEPKVTYEARLKLEKKISLLPNEIYKNLEELVDSILNKLNHE
jgi:transcriptional regulator with XRE-family HTH domain